MIERIRVESIGRADFFPLDDPDEAPSQFKRSASMIIGRSHELADHLGEWNVEG
jgi:hypothetical protein